MSLFWLNIWNTLFFGSYFLSAFWRCYCSVFRLPLFLFRSCCLIVASLKVIWGDSLAAFRIFFFVLFCLVFPETWLWTFLGVCVCVCVRACVCLCMSVCFFLFSSSFSFILDVSFTLEYPFLVLWVQYSLRILMIVFWSFLFLKNVCFTHLFFPLFICFCLYFPC